MAVLWTFRAPALCRHVPREFMRHAVLHLTLIIPATAYNKRNYVGRYSRFRSQEFIRHIPKWVKRGLIIKYLPPYSPELNLIEILWRFIKYHWLPFSASMSFSCLVQAVEDILTRFGTDYTINFQAT